MIIEERTKKVIKLFLRFLKQENLLVEFKKDFNPNLKLKSVGIICEKQISSLEEFIQIRLNKCYGRYDDLLSLLIDRTLVFDKCKYKHWHTINVRWIRFFYKNTTFLKLRLWSIINVNISIGAIWNLVGENFI